MSEMMGADDRTGERPSVSIWRAWWAVVILSLKRQMILRQMVWIALALLLLATCWVGIQTARGRWNVRNWLSPRRAGLSYLQWRERTHLLMAAVQRSPEGHAIENAVFGSVGVIITPSLHTKQGAEYAISDFQVFAQTVVFGLFVTFLLPLWSLSFATESFGGERETQSMIWLLSRPIPRWAIYSARFVALLPWTLGLNLGGFALLCLVAGTPGRLSLELFWWPIVCASFTFSALFLLVGAVFRRPAIVAIIYSFCLEVVIGNMPGYLKRLSVGYYARCMMYETAGEYGIQPDRPTVFLPVESSTAMQVLAVSGIVLLGLGMWLFSRIEYHEVDGA